MSWPWADDTVLRIRPAEVEDSHGDERPDWDHADEVTLDGISFAPKDDGDGGTLYALTTLDVAAGDHLVWHDRRFEVLGIPQDWGIGTVVLLGGVDIPGQ